MVETLHILSALSEGVLITRISDTYLHVHRTRKTVYGLLIIVLIVLMHAFINTNAAIPAGIAGMFLIMNSYTQNRLSQEVLWYVLFQYAVLECTAQSAFLLVSLFSNVYTSAAETLCITALIRQLTSACILLLTIRSASGTYVKNRLPATAISAVYLFIMHAVIHQSYGIDSRILMILSVFPVLTMAALQYGQEQKTALLEKEQEAVSRDQMQKAYTEQIRVYENNQKKLRILKHDMKNELTVLMGYLQNEEYDRCREILRKSIDRVDRITVPSMTGSAAIDAILSVKLDMARNAGIRVSSTIQIQHRMTAQMEFETAMILGNLLDNAIENKTEESPWLRVSVTDEGQLVIKVENAADQTAKTISKGKADPEEHGFGLMIVRSIAGKHDGTVSVSMQDGIYTAYVIMNADRQMPAAEADN